MDLEVESAVFGIEEAEELAAFFAILDHEDLPGALKKGNMMQVRISQVYIEPAVDLQNSPSCIGFQAACDYVPAIIIATDARRGVPLHELGSKA